MADTTQSRSQASQTIEKPVLNTVNAASFSVGNRLVTLSVNASETTR
jgi:hypothetical protein